MRLVLLAHPEQARVTSFCRACHDAGVEQVQVIAYSDWLTNEQCLLAALTEPCWLKLEAIGEHTDCQRYLINQGFLMQGLALSPTLEHGEFAYLEAAFLGFKAALLRLKKQLTTRPWVRCLNTIDDVLLMSDKFQCQHHLIAHDVRTPSLLGRFTGFAELQELMHHHQQRRVFLKPRYGSSASGVIALDSNGKGQWLAKTSLHWQHDNNKLYNVLRIQSYRDGDAIALIDRLREEQFYAEAWIPKPCVNGRSIDYRVISLAGQAQQRVARLACSPLTNLHLGNQRGLACAYLSTQQTQQLEQVSAQVAGCFPHSTVFGIDLIVRKHTIHVLEVNAFGDWLPRLQWHGRTVHEAEIAWLQQQATGDLS